MAGAALPGAGPPPGTPGQPPGAPRQPSTSRRLTRSRTDRMIGGVAGGIARTYGFDPALVRLAFGGLALVAFRARVPGYLVAWLVIPGADADEPILTAAVRDVRHRAPDRRLIVGVALVIAGAFALAGRLGASRVS